MASKVNTDKIAQASGTPEFTIPTADGTSGQFIKTNASGVLSFGSAPSLTGSTNTWIPTITAANALTGTANFTYDGNTLDVKNSGTASSIKLYCENANAHAQEIKAAPHVGSSAWTLTLPGVVPTVSGQALTATTAGVSSWTTVADTSLSNLVSTGADKIVKAWVCFDGNPLTIRDSFNVSSITDAGVGAYVANWDTDFANASYAVVAGGSASSGGGDYMQTQNTLTAVGTTPVYAYTGGGGSTWDPNYISIIAIGDQ